MRKTAVIIGVLFWISNLVTVAGSLVAGTIPTSSVALTGMAPHATQIVAGTLLAQLNGVAIIAYAVLLYPMLRQRGQVLAHAYVAFKVVEAVLLAVAAVALLSLIALSRSFLTGAPDASPFHAIAAVVLAQQFWAARIAALAYLVATPLLNIALYRSRLVPRFIPLWGFAALAMLAAGIAAGVGDPTHGLAPAQLLVVPIILWELTIATWLIVRGFEPDARFTRAQFARPAATVSGAAALGAGAVQ